MLREKYTEEQIITVLREGEAGKQVDGLCRKYGMGDAPHYNWMAYPRAIFTALIWVLRFYTKLYRTTWRNRDGF